VQVARLAFRGDSKCDVRRVSSQRAPCDVRRARRLARLAQAARISLDAFKWLIWMAHLNGSFVQVARTSLLATSDLRLAFRGDSKCDVRRVSSQRAPCDVRRATCSSPTRQKDLCAARQRDLCDSSKRPPLWLVKETLSLARHRGLFDESAKCKSPVARRTSLKPL